jgi:hypothetical protein
MATRRSILALVLLSNGACSTSGSPSASGPKDASESRSDSDSSSEEASDSGAGLNCNASESVLCGGGPDVSGLAGKPCCPNISCTGEDGYAACVNGAYVYTSGYSTLSCGTLSCLAPSQACVILADADGGRSYSCQLASDFGYGCGVLGSACSQCFQPRAGCNCSSNAQSQFVVTCQVQDDAGRSSDAAGPDASPD